MVECVYASDLAHNPVQYRNSDYIANRFKIAPDTDEYRKVHHTLIKDYCSNLQRLGQVPPLAFSNPTFRLPDQTLEIDTAGYAILEPNNQKFRYIATDNISECVIVTLHAPGIETMMAHINPHTNNKGIQRIIDDFIAMIHKKNGNITKIEVRYLEGNSPNATSEVNLNDVSGILLKHGIHPVSVNMDSNQAQRYGGYSIDSQTGVVQEYKFSGSVNLARNGSILSMPGPSTPFGTVREAMYEHPFDYTKMHLDADNPTDISCVISPDGEFDIEQCKQQATTSQSIK